MYSYRLQALSALRMVILVACVGVSFFIFSQSAQAANTVSTAVYQDTDANGTINRIRWTMDENVTACTFDSLDWTVNTASEMNFVITALSCTTTDAFLDITVTSDANETGAATAPVISYANVGTAGSVTLTSGVMTGKASQSTTDGAAPTVVSTSPASAATGVSVSADIIITFSEAMDTGFVEATEFTMSPDPGAFTSAFTVSDSVVTLTFPNMVCGAPYTLTTIEAAIIASAGSVTTLVTTGAQDGDWTFNPTTCGAAAASPVVISSFEYAGPDCTADNSQSFAVTGTNIDAYLVSADQYFGDAVWQSQNIEGSGTIEATFDDSDTWAYLVLKSDAGTVGSTYSFELDDWSQTCSVTAEDEVADEVVVEDSPVTETEEGSVIVVDGVSPGDVIHSSSSSAVYYVTETYGRRVFINEQTYFTWFASFDVVMEVEADTLAALPIEGNMLPKAGIVLVKIQSSAVVYFLGTGTDSLVPELREVPDEATANTLFGSYWANYVIDIEPTFFTKFESGSAVSSSENLGVDVSDMKMRVDLHD